MQTQALYIKNRLAGVRKTAKHYLADDFNAVRITGQLKKSQETLSVFYAGRADWVRSFDLTFFNGFGKIEKLGGLFPFALARQALDLGAAMDDVLVVDDGPLGPYMHPERLWVPALVDTVFSPGDDFEAYRMHQMGDTLKWEYNKAEREQFTTRFSTSQSDLRGLYENMLLPASEARHGDSAALPPFEEFLRRAPKCELLLLEKEGRTLAGTACEIDKSGSSIFAWRNGMLPEFTSNPKLMNCIYVKMNVAIIQRACQEKIVKVCFGYVSPLMGDGLLAYKLKWGCAVMPLPYKPLFSVRFMSGKAHASLVSRPLIHVRSSGFDGLMAFDPGVKDAIKEFKSLLSRYKFPGLGEIQVLLANPASDAAETFRHSVRAEKLPCRVRFIGSLSEVGCSL